MTRLLLRKLTPRQLERVKVVVLGGAGGARREGLCPSNVLTTADSEEASKLLKRCRSQRVGSIRSEHLDNYGGGELGGGAPLRHRLSGSGSRPPEPDVEMKRDMRENERCTAEAQLGVTPAQPSSPFRTRELERKTTRARGRQ